VSRLRLTGLCLMAAAFGLLLTGCAELVSQGVREDVAQVHPEVRSARTPDRWDPQDDTLAGASALPISAVLQMHGTRATPHTIGYAEDKFDYFRVWVEALGTYTFSVTADGGALDVVLFYVDPVTSAEMSVTVARQDRRTWTLRLTHGPLGFEGPTGWWWVRVAPGTASSQTSYVLNYQYAKGLLDRWDPGDDAAKRGRNLGSANSPGQHGRHTLSEQDTADWFVVTLSAGRTYRFQTSPESSANLDLYLYKKRCGPLATPVASGKNGTPLTYTPSRDGAFCLKAVADPVGDVASYVLDYGPAP